HYPGRPPVYRQLVRDQFPRMLAAAAQSPIKMTGFVAFDPFRPDCLEVVKGGIAMGFAGVKFYPPNGYRPIGNSDADIVQYPGAPVKLTGAKVDAANKAFFQWCIAGDIPIFTHCTSGGMESRPGETGVFSDAKGWK